MGNCDRPSKITFDDMRASCVSGVKTIAAVTRRRSAQSDGPMTFGFPTSRDGSHARRAASAART